MPAAATPSESCVAWPHAGKRPGVPVVHSVAVAMKYCVMVAGALALGATVSHHMPAGGAGGTLLKLKGKHWSFS